jgi:hypothetical protein
MLTVGWLVRFGYLLTCFAKCWHALLAGINHITTRPHEMLHPLAARCQFLYLCTCFTSTELASRHSTSRKVYLYTHTHKHTHTQKASSFRHSTSRNVSVFVPMYLLYKYRSCLSPQHQPQGVYIYIYLIYLIYLICMYVYIYICIKKGFILSPQGVSICTCVLALQVQNLLYKYTSTNAWQKKTLHPLAAAKGARYTYIYILHMYGIYVCIYIFFILSPPQTQKI